MTKGGLAGAKPWQIVVIVVAVVAMGGSLAWSLTRGPKVKVDHKMLLVDVTSGQLFEFSTKGRAVILPERHPDTGKIALFPVTKEGEKWVIEARYLSELSQVEGEPTAVVDKGSGEVRVESEKARRVDSRAAAKKHANG